MKSFAIYYKVQEEYQTEAKTSVLTAEDKAWGSKKSKELEKYPDVGELHVNIWKVNHGRLLLHPVFYIDVGIKFSFKCEQVRIFVPFVTKKEYQMDLCKSIMDYRELMCAVFNDEVLPTPQNNTCYCKVESQTNARSFYLYRLASDNVEFEEYMDGETQVGTYITLTIKGNPANEDDNKSFKDQQLYVRLRLFIEENREFVITEHVSNDLLQAAFSQTDLFDLRFNEKREIDGKVQEKMKTDGFESMLFDKVHVFYIADTREDVENESALKIDSRLLEKQHWIPYEPENKLHNTHYVAHHWRKRRKEEQEPFADASVFFSTKYPNIDLWRLVSYFSVAILLGWIGSMLTLEQYEGSNGYADWRNFVRLVIVGVLFLFVICLAVKVNLGMTSMKIFRKR